MPDKQIVHGTTDNHHHTGLIIRLYQCFHDAANAIATIVSTKVLTPLQAVIWAACFNFIAFFIAKYVIGDFGIANTVSKNSS